MENYVWAALRVSGERRKQALLPAIRVCGGGKELVLLPGCRKLSQNLSECVEGMEEALIGGTGN